MDRVGVVGFGLMGAGIAEVCARAGLDVVVCDASKSAVTSGLTRIERSLTRAQQRGKIDDPTEVLGRIRVTQDLEDLADRELVIEAVVENESVKTELFQRLDTIVTCPTAVLATNTSSIPVMKLAVATSRPQQVIGIHFFNPVPVLQLVELVPSLLTSPDTTGIARSFVEEQLGKKAIDCTDRAGFVVNALRSNRANSVSPSTYSMTMKVEPACSPMS